MVTVEVKAAIFYTICWNDFLHHTNLLLGAHDLEASLHDSTTMFMSGVKKNFSSNLFIKHIFVSRFQLRKKQNPLNDIVPKTI